MSNSPEENKIQERRLMYTGSPYALYLKIVYFDIDNWVDRYFEQGDTDLPPAAEAMLWKNSTRSGFFLEVVWLERITLCSEILWLRELFSYVFDFVRVSAAENTYNAQ